MSAAAAVRPVPLLLRCLAGERVERPPVWAMRQAGRWDPEFNKLRQGLSFYEFSERADLAAEASLLPRRFGVDAIILFYDITTLPIAMGLPFQLRPGVGPQPDRPIRTLTEVEQLDAEPDPSRYGFLVELAQRVKKELAGALPILVFAGAPFTVASYCIGVGKDIAAARRFAAEQPEAWGRLLGKLGSATVAFLQTLLKAGGDAWQLFDSWAGALTPAEYAAWAEPHHRSLISAVREKPSILFVNENPHVERSLTSGATALSLGARHDLARLRQAHPQTVFQGNVATELMRDGRPEDVAAATERCLAAGGGQRHIVNLSHGMDRAAPVANFQAFVDAVRRHRNPLESSP